MKLVVIVGPSGSGKDTVAHMLSDMTGIPVLVSYTTRPMRDGEQNGREHWFVSECKVPRHEMLAYTEYGGYKYWTCQGQLVDTSIYVIDEDGLRDMQKRFPFIKLTKIHVEANRMVRRMRGVTVARMNRDDLREQFPSVTTTIPYRITGARKISANNCVTSFPYSPLNPLHRPTLRGVHRSPLSTLNPQPSTI